ncbi:2Fe-2S iron-sulfur cluster-binding protein [Halorientalis regularis]|jgi:ferredoxin|uniref:Ferredoxin n=1 Tax=Halorientalis regularis TaxID=660518 RepID=A0A1G7IQZ3_9EURY|nr:2Fe-2S iron-sulfur cluster-binding protein [Halorientalis regularis]SDF15035.1 ferredoxin [Halorientalis regularis]
MSGRADRQDEAGEEVVTDDGEYEVTLEHEGEDVTLSVDEDEYILDAAEEAGLDLPYSCRKGQCTSCVGTVEEGEIDQSEGAALDPMQEDDGFALLCITYPKSDCTIETDTQSDLFGGDMDIL